MVERRYSELKIDIKRRWILKAESDLAHLVEHSTKNRKAIGAIPIIDTNGGMVGYNHLALFDFGFVIADFGLFCLQLIIVISDRITIKKHFEKDERSLTRMQIRNPQSQIRNLREV